MKVVELEQIRVRDKADNPMNVMVDRRELLAFVDELIGANFALAEERGSADDIFVALPSGIVSAAELLKKYLALGGQ